MSDYSKEFKDEIRGLFNGLKFEVIDHEDLVYDENKYYPDFFVTKNEVTAIVEIKFYRSRKVARDTLIAAASPLAEFAERDIHKILVVSSIVSNSLKHELQNNYGVIVWDRSNIANFAAANSSWGDFTLHDFAQLIMDAQQGIDTADPYVDIDEDTNSDPESYFIDSSKENPRHFEVSAIITNGNQLISILQNTETGKEHYLKFEQTGFEILNFLFEDDLSVWDKQKRSDDELSRFDLICRIKSNDDFWKTMVTSFFSRFILFEFKNYSELIKQGQIYTTERYLFPKALRGIGIIITRKGLSPQAITATKGALRESGKLILSLKDEDLVKMIQMKQKGSSPNDYLSDKLDEFLISLSR